MIVLNDDHNTFQGVAFALASVLPSTSYEQGMELANRIHNTGHPVLAFGRVNATRPAPAASGRAACTFAST